MTPRKKESAKRLFFFISNHHRAIAGQLRHHCAIPVVP